MSNTLKNTRALVVGLATLLASSHADADSYYKISVSKEESNLYKIDNTNMYIRTKGCYEFANSASAILVWKGRSRYAGNKIAFLGYDGSTRNECDVLMVLEEVSP